MTPQRGNRPQAASPAKPPCAAGAAEESPLAEMRRRLEEKHRFPLQVSRVMAGVVAVLLAIFFFTTTTNLISIMHQMEAIKEGPYPVSVAAGRIETLLVQLRTITASPAALNDSVHAGRLREQFDEINQDMMERIDFIIANTATDDQEANALKVGYEDMMGRQQVLRTMCLDPDTTDAEVEHYVETRIEPLIQGLLLLDVGLLEDSSTLVDQTYAAVGQSAQQVLLVSVILMGAVITSVVVYLTVLTRANRQQEELQRSLTEALEAAQAASSAKSAFLANMSHDIRTPMNAIVGLTSIAQAHVNDPERVAEYLNRITVSSKHLLNLINDILDMSKIESGKFLLTEVPFSLPEMTSKFIDIVYPQMRAKHLRFDICIFDIAHEALIGDTLRLSQMLLNLTSNAVKYTPEGGRVTVKITQDEGPTPDQVLVHFEVEDSGIGMTPEFLGRVFDVFERERNDTTNFIQGTGLGMAIVKSIVDMMGGSIDVESEPDVGTRFAVTVPLRIDPEEAQVAAPGTAEERASLRLLVVDDNPNVRGNIRRVMDGWDIRADVASSGKEAIELVAEAHEEGAGYSAVIMDWIMPELDGLSTTRQLQQALGDAAPPVLLATYEEATIGAQAREAGVTRLIAKPLYRSRLRDAIAEACGDAKQEKASDAPEPGGPLSGRVLLVEDNEINREIALELIGQFGVEADFACDGLEAVEAMEEAEPGTYGIIFMDWQMPRMDGIAATQAIIESEQARGIPHTPIVAMTANAFSEDKERALAAGMDGFMTKPISVRLLEETLRKYLG